MNRPVICEKGFVANFNMKAIFVLPPRNKYLALFIID